MGALAQTDYWMWLYLLDLTCISWFSESSTEKSGVFSWHASKSEKAGITIFVTSIFSSSSPETSWVCRAFQPQALETASSKASSVLLPPAEDLAVSYPLEVRLVLPSCPPAGAGFCWRFFWVSRVGGHSKWRQVVIPRVGVAKTCEDYPILLDEAHQDFFLRWYVTNQS